MTDRRQTMPGRKCNDEIAMDVLSGGAPYVMVVNPSVPANTVPDFIAYAKANSGKISFGSPGIGTPGHVAGELFKMMAKVEMIHVPYRGGGAVLSDLLGGRFKSCSAPRH